MNYLFVFLCVIGFSFKPHYQNESYVDYSYYDYYGDINLIYSKENEFKLNSVKCKFLDSLARKLNVKFEDYIIQPKFTIYQSNQEGKRINRKRINEIVKYLKSKNQFGKIGYDISWKLFSDLKFDDNKDKFSGKILITLILKEKRIK